MNLSLSIKLKDGRRGITMADRGALKLVESLPNRTEDDCREVDQLVKVIAHWDWVPPWSKEP